MSGTILCDCSAKQLRNRPPHEDMSDRSILHASSHHAVQRFGTCTETAKRHPDPATFTSFGIGSSTKSVLAHI